jgi:hypothetical protein
MALGAGRGAEGPVRERETRAKAPQLREYADGDGPCPHVEAGYPVRDLPAAVGRV